MPSRRNRSSKKGGDWSFGLLGTTPRTPEQIDKDIAALEAEKQNLINTTPSAPPAPPPNPPPATGGKKSKKGGRRRKRKTTKRRR